MEVVNTAATSKIRVRGLWQSIRESTDLTGMRTNLTQALGMIRVPKLALRFGLVTYKFILPN